MASIINNPPGTGPTGAAISFVEQGWDFFEGKANQFTNATLQLIANLQFVPEVEPVQFHVDFPSISGLTSFTPPPRPVLDDIAFAAIPVPEAPSLQLPAEEAGSQMPAFDVAQPTPIALPSQPGALDVEKPGAAPQLSELVLPDKPDYKLPELPKFFDVVIPEMPEINYPTFQGNDPGDAPLPPDLSGVGFTEQPYTRELLNDIIPQVRQSLAGNTGLSAAIEAQLFGRARDRTRKTSLKARQEVANEFASRGFTEPPGAFAARMAEQTQRDQDADNDINRDLSIAFHEQAIKNVQFAVVQGIALEQVLIAQHGSIMDRQLQSAKLLLDAKVAFHNADVASYNAKIERFKADADVFRTRIEGEIARIEGFKAEVEGQRAIADVNKSLADLYDSGVRGVLGLVEIYTSEVNAVRAKAEIESLRIEAHRSEVQSYAEQVRAYVAQWDGYRSAVEAQSAGFRTFEIGVNAYNARVNAWGRGEEVKVARQDSRLRGATLTLEQYRSRIQEVVARLQVESGRIGALGTKADAQARIYGADAQIEAARNDANTRAFEAQLNYYDRRTQVQLREAEIKIQDASRLLNAQIAAMSGATQALAQLSASSMGAVNFSAGVSGSGSESSGYSYSLSKSKGWSWGGETEDNNAPDSF